MLKDYIFIIGLSLLPILVILVLPLGAFRILRSWRQTLIWEASLLLASSVTLLGYFRMEAIFSPLLPIPANIVWVFKILAVLSPTCIAVALLRLGGMKWRLSLALFPLVPAGMVTLWVIVEFPFWAS